LVIFVYYFFKPSANINFLDVSSIQKLMYHRGRRLVYSNN